MKVVKVASGTRENSAEWARERTLYSLREKIREEIIKNANLGNCRASLNFSKDVTEHIETLQKEFRDLGYEVDLDFQMYSLGVVVQVRW